MHKCYELASILLFFHIEIDEEDVVLQRSYLNEC